MDQIFKAKNILGQDEYQLQKEQDYYGKISMKDNYEERLAKYDANGLEREKAKLKVQQEDLDRYLGRINEQGNAEWAMIGNVNADELTVWSDQEHIDKKIEKYNALSLEESDAMEKMVNLGASNRSVSKRKGKIKKSAELYQELKNMGEQRKRLGGPEHAYEKAILELEMLEKRLKAMRYAAEAKGFSKENEAYRKQNAELKIRGAQIALIQSLLNQDVEAQQNAEVQRVQLTDKQKSALAAKLSTYQKKYNAYEVSYREQYFKLQREEKINALTKEEKEEITKETSDAYTRYNKPIEEAKGALDYRLNYSQQLRNEVESYKQQGQMDLAEKAQDTLSHQSTYVEENSIKMNDLVAKQYALTDLAIKEKNTQKKAEYLMHGLDKTSPLIPALEKFLLHKGIFIKDDVDMIQTLEGYASLYETYEQNKNQLTKAEKTTIENLLQTRGDFLQFEEKRIVECYIAKYTGKEDFREFKLPHTMEEYEKILIVDRYKKTFKARSILAHEEDVNTQTVVNDKMKELHPGYEQSGKDVRFVQTFNIYFLNQETWELENNKADNCLEPYFKCVSGSSKERCQAVADHLVKFDQIVNNYANQLIEITGAKFENGVMLTPPLQLTDDNIEKYRKYIRGYEALNVQASTIAGTGKVKRGMYEVGDGQYEDEDMKEAMAKITKERLRINYNFERINSLLFYGDKTYKSKNGINPTTGAIENTDAYRKLRNRNDNSEAEGFAMTNAMTLKAAYDECIKNGVEV